MSDVVDLSQPAEQSHYENAEYLKTEWEGRQTDWLLQWLVRFSNNTRLSIGITLSVGGSLVSGQLITHGAYFEQLSKDFSEAFRKFEGVDVEELQSAIQTFDSPPQDDDPQPAMQYLHLKDAKVYTSSSTPVLSGGQLWRGKISSVDGFTLGTITKS